MTGARGFVLVNALVLVGALAAAAMILLVRAELSVTRQSSGLEAAQAGLSLDALEALAMTRLDRDLAGGGAVLDHPGEPWAQPLDDAEIGRARGSAVIEDLQGRFNLNWLSVPEDAAVREAFARLVTAQGLPAALATGLPAALEESGPLLDPIQLRGMRGLDASTLDRLAPLVATLPSDSRLNVNTAHPAVLAAVVPGLELSRAQGLATERLRRPFADVGEFVDALPGDLAAETEAFRLSIASAWFEARIETRFGSRLDKRRVVLRRDPLPVGTRVHYRLPDG